LRVRIHNEDIGSEASTHVLIVTDQTVWTEGISI